MRIKLINNKNEKKIIIEIDNEISYFEENIDFSNYSTDIKPIALFLPQFHSIKENDKWWGKGFTEWKNVKKAKPLYEGHHQPRIPGDQKKYLGYYDLTKKDVFKKQVKLAKSHGIYGFGIYYYWFSGKTLLEKPLFNILKDKTIDFNFLLIWANENWTRRWDGNDQDVLIKQEYKKNDPANFINDIKKYIIDKRYIKIKGKPIIGIYEPYKIPNLKETLLIWRKKSMEYKIGELYIIASLNDHKVEDLHKINLFNAIYQFSPRDSMTISTLIEKKPFYLYTATLYNKFNLKYVPKDFHFYRGSMIEFDNSARKKDCVIFKNYSPEQFYMINKKIIKWTKRRYKKDNRFIFINAWNEWGEGTYLEPDEKYGYASINSLSKAIFNLSYVEHNLTLLKINNQSTIAVQIHIYYEDLIIDIINKTNNIPIKYDLFISTDSIKKKDIIEQNIKISSKANKYEIKIYKNKGRDVLPFLLQFRNNIKKYKYICHLHTKKTIFTYFGDEWRNYLYNNLLGNEKIISEILTDFRNNEKLGIIFPEAFYKVIIEYGMEVTKKDRFYMNYLLRQINKKYKIGKRIEFPISLYLK